MAPVPESDPAGTDERLLATLRRGCLWLGGILCGLGGLALAAPWAAATAIDYVVGGSLILAGGSQLAMAAGTYSWRGFWVAVVCGALSLVAGTALLAIPVAGVHVLATFIGLVILFEAAAKLTASFTLPPEFPRGWLVVDGLTTALIGGVLLIAPAANAGAMLGILVGMNLLSSGIAFLVGGLSLPAGGSGGAPDPSGRRS